MKKEEDKLVCKVCGYKLIPLFKKKDSIMIDKVFSENVKFKIELTKMVKYLDTVFNYPDASERRNDIQQYIDDTVREVISKYYNN
jgi:hypothetical protein